MARVAGIPEMSELPQALKAPLTELLLSVADDKFILGHRNADWTGLAPILEEDIAFSALAQDDIAHASALYELIAGLNDGGDPNGIAYGRSAEQYRCAQIVELHDEFDWSVALVRQFYCDHFESLRLARLSESSYKPLADLARKMSREERLAVGHADGWIVRLCHATDDARKRMRDAFDRITPMTTGLFEPTEGVEALEEAGVYPRLKQPMFERWEEMVENVIEEAGLQVRLPRPNADERAGRRGVHSPGFAALLEELAEVYRIEPEAKW